jgi:deoxyribodipyrimidine photo-lyase
MRRDLRLEDNNALFQAEKTSETIIPIFIFDESILSKLTDKDDARLTFIYETLESIKEQLNSKKSSLLTFHGKPIDIFKSLSSALKFQAVFANEDYEPYAIQRDKKIQSVCNEANIDFHLLKDQVLFAKDDIVKPDGSPYTVFTPFSKRWKSTMNEQGVPKYNSTGTRFSKNLLELRDFTYNINPSLEDLGFRRSSLCFPARIIKRKTIADYHNTRNTPSISGTSKLSLHLRFGTISARMLIALAKDTNETWLNELIWREFYMAILWHFPATTNNAFKAAYDEIPWRNDQADYNAWKDGLTGYPLVDAGMRELNQTGFMHNRVRMLTASFLTKHLLIDWRWGERYFARKLLDFELSSNVGGWQWAAGCGTDAAPYFRIFSPDRQQEKFDPEMIYIRKYISEYEQGSYPSPIIDHKFARERCLSTYKAALNS